jgi:hypothetical protein
VEKAFGNSAHERFKCVAVGVQDQRDIGRDQRGGVVAAVIIGVDGDVER